MPDDLKDRLIVLAGGSGGLGAATAEWLAREGARLIVSYHSDQERATRLEKIARVVRCDITSAADRRELLDHAEDLYALVVFAGDPSRAASGGEVEQAMRRSYEVNCVGPLMLAREVAERMRASAIAGSIVLFSTMQAVSLFSGSTAYAAGKAGLIHGARILAKECRGPANIRVNVVAPGVIDAGMAKASITSGKYDRFIKDGVVHRFGAAVDIARTVRFLLEPDNYITGQVISVDGGMTLGL